MKETIVSIHQPAYFPRLHYFARIMSSDVFILLDDVQLSRKGDQARTHLVSKDGLIRLSVPLTGSHKVLLNEVDYANYHWIVKHKKSFRSIYGNRSPFWIDMITWFLDNVGENNIKFSEMCEMFIKYMVNVFDWKGTLYVSSKDKELHSTQGLPPQERVLKLTQLVGGTVYQCGESAFNNYMEEDLFLNAGVDIKIQNWKPFVYPQLNKEFIPNASVVDALLMTDDEDLVKNELMRED